MQRTTIQNTQYAIRNTQYVRRSTGLALILAVVLTSLLAVIAVTFLLTSRMDSIATSAIAENKELGFAVDTVIAKISNELVADIPHTDANGVPLQEYYDYPDACNAWLASLEPYQLALNNYRWRRITDLYGVLEFCRQGGYLDTYNDLVDPNNLRVRLWADSAPVTGAHRTVPTIDNVDFGGPADADGDGVADSRWIRLPNITSGKGKAIYAAIRIIDNSAMLNVNTAYKFDPNTATLADGSSQSNINLLGLSWRDLTHSFIARNQRLLSFRAGLTSDPNNIPAYEQNVVWNYGTPKQMYTPFDISDELKLRNRYQINYNLMVCRIEELWESCFDGPFYVPRKSGDKLEDWFWKANYSSLDPNLYDYRHIATTDNLDRVVTPRGTKMLNINTVNLMDPCDVYLRIRNALLDGWPFIPALHAAIDSRAAQIAANLIDYRDADDDVSVVYDYANVPHFGFETPCVYISEVAQRFIHFDANTPDAMSYAIELYKPYWEDPFPSTDPNHAWQLRINETTTVPIVWSGTPRFHVIKRTDPNAPIDVNWSDVPGPNDVNEPNNPLTPQPSDAIAFAGGDFIELQRRIPELNDFITVDWVWVPEPNASVGWLMTLDANDINERTHSYQRDIGKGINNNKLVRGRPIAAGIGLWSLDFGVVPVSTIGTWNPWTAPEPYVAPYVIQAHPANAGFTNVGEIGMLFATSAYSIGRGHTESVIPLDPDLLPTRLNLADPRFQSLFRYLTVIDPTDYGHPLGETRIKGRISINTAPWFVLAQLPWVSPGLAQAIVAYRDKTIGPGSDYTARPGPAGFDTVGRLNNVIDVNAFNSMDYYARTDGPMAGDQVGLPDLPQTNPVELVDFDGSPDDFEERDLIFSRISNLVTVRSDIFTAYILVRIGRNGPQKRVVAILDRSEVTAPTDKVKLIALHPVADPR